jgi:ABC-type sugar transport system ATPase subunit
MTGSEENILEFNDVVKSYPGVMALSHVSLAFRKGEVHAIVGENGAGKSTLIKMTTGAVIPTSGSITIDGERFTRLSPAKAREKGVAVIYQEFNLVNELSIAENIFLGDPIAVHGFINKKAMVKKSQEIFDMLGINVNVMSQVKDLTTGYKQLVEIAKAFTHDVKILIMDEPSASLTTNEVDTLFSIIHKLESKGVTVVYISHRLEEIFEISDRVSVLRDGHMIGTYPTASKTKDQLISLMVGRQFSEQFPDRSGSTEEEVVLRAEHLSGPKVKDASFALRKGEILGFGGLVGAGRTETVQLICGINRLTGGKITYKGKDFVARDPLDAINKGIVMAPEDRKEQGLMLHMSVGENIAFPSYHVCSKLGFINYSRTNQIIRKYIESLSIKTPSQEQLVRNLSGGNQQKIVLAKWLARDPEVIILDEPTRGIDVAAKAEIYEIMVKLAESGKSVIMISSDMEELLGMSDRIVVFCEGKVTGELKKSEFSQESVLSLASVNNSTEKEHKYE